MAIISFKKGENKQLSRHFNSKEFECNCKQCEINYIDEDFIEKIEIVREEYGKPIKVNSGYRCPAHNKAIGGAANSSHTSGMAGDVCPIVVTLDSLDELYDICYDVFDNIGDGRNKGFVHVDSRPKKASGKRTWLY